MNQNRIKTIYCELFCLKYIDTNAHINIPITIPQVEYKIELYVVNVSADGMHQINYDEDPNLIFNDMTALSSMIDVFIDRAVSCPLSLLFIRHI